MYQWVDNIRAFEIEETELGAADALTIQLVFKGTGETPASPDEQRLMREMADQFITQLTLDAKTGNLEAARQTLEEYFTALNQARYADAANLYAGEYQILRDNNRSLARDDYSALFEAACLLNGFVCNLTIKNVVSAAQISPTQFRFSVELQDPDGNLFILGPCCGATAVKLPPVSQFDFIVQMDEGKFSVLDLPIYVP